jgi:hypothetical protein
MKATTRRDGCATHQTAKTTKGWKRVSSGQARRLALKERCPGAFAYDGPKGLHFPVVPEGSTSCCVDCRGARVAFGRARQWRQKYPDVAKKIHARAKSAGCKWAQ